MNTYFTHISGENQGPFNLEELKAQNISSETSIWRQGLPTWKRAGDLEELKGSYTVSSPHQSHFQQSDDKEKTNADLMMLLFICFLAFQGLFWIVFSYISFEVFEFRYYEHPWITHVIRLTFAIVPLILTLLVRNSKVKTALIIVSIIPIITSIVNLFL